MTTETVCVPRDELLELLEDGVDDYWITSESGVRIVGTLRAILAQPAPVIPEGYALVPIEPTEAMRDAGNIYSLNRATLMRIWADMLGAAQQPTEGSTDE